MLRLIDPAPAAPPAGASETIRAVLDLAHALDDLAETTDYAKFAGEITHLSTGYERWTATRYTASDRPSFAVLHRMLDALIALDKGLVWTKAGWFTKDQLAAAECLYEHSGDGDTLIVFPVRYPWEVTPSKSDADRYVEGVRARAIVRPKEQRNPKRGEFGIQIRVERDDEAHDAPQTGWER